MADVKLKLHSFKGFICGPAMHLFKLVSWLCALQAEDLKETQHYPVGFGKALVRWWSSHLPREAEVTWLSSAAPSGEGLCLQCERSSVLVGMSVIVTICQ